MAQGPAIEYVQLYTYGSAARKLEPTIRVQQVFKTKARKRKKIIIRLDPMAALGMVVAVIMLFMMIGGIAQLQAAREQTQIMEQYVQTLQEENQALEARYKGSYDPEEVEQMALALGMVPADQLQRVGLQLSVPQQPDVQTLSFWDRLSSMLAVVFA